MPDLQFQFYVSPEMFRILFDLAGNILLVSHDSAMSNIATNKRFYDYALIDVILVIKLQIR